MSDSVIISVYKNISCESFKMGRNR